jgi:sulfur-oxidizing protein SoxX
MTSGRRRHALARRVRAAALRALVAGAALLPAAQAAAADALASWAATGDGIVAPLAAAGDASRGRRLVVARDPANCVLCHAVPDAEVRFAGDVGPSLAGVGARLSAAQLRLAIVDNARRVPQTVMPGYYRVDGLVDVAPAWRGRPILAAQDVEDLVAYLETLK